MGVLVLDTTNMGGEGAADSAIGIDEATAEAQDVCIDRTLRCGHPAVAGRANVVELASDYTTIAASGEEREFPCHTVS